MPGATPYRDAGTSREAWMPGATPCRDGHSVYGPEQILDLLPISPIPAPCITGMFSETPARPQGLKIIVAVTIPSMYIKGIGTRHIVQ